VETIGRARVRHVVVGVRQGAEVRRGGGRVRGVNFAADDTSHE
jgi:hypothetical protein